MPTALRVLPGLTALTLSFLSAYVFATSLGQIFDGASNLQFFFTVSILLAGAATPLLIANGMYLATVTPQAVGNDIGGVGLMLLGTVALLLTSLVFIFALPAAHPIGADRLDNRPTRSHN